MCDVFLSLTLRYVIRYAVDVCVGVILMNILFVVNRFQPPMYVVRASFDSCELMTFFNFVFTYE